MSDVKRGLPSDRRYVVCDKCSPDHYLGLGYLPGSADLPCVCRLRGTPGLVLETTGEGLKRGLPSDAEERTRPSTRRDSECPKCGQYMPLRLNETGRVHDCHRTPPIGDLPYSLCACPVCGGYAPFRAGCWGTVDDPHDHAYMIPIHELVAS